MLGRGMGLEISRLTRLGEERGRRWRGCRAGGRKGWLLVWHRELRGSRRDKTDGTTEEEEDGEGWDCLEEEVEIQTRKRRLVPLLKTLLKLSVWRRREDREWGRCR